MGSPSLEFWFEFASTYSYIAAMRIEDACGAAGGELRWRPFTLGPIFAAQGWNDSHFNLNPLRGAYMWRDMERLTEKFGLPFGTPSVFPRNTIAPLRVACNIAHESWMGAFVRAMFVANFGNDRSIDDENVVAEVISELGHDPQPILAAAASPNGRAALRANTERAIALGIFGAPNCVVGNELFWGEEAVDDAIAWSRKPRT